MCFAALINYLTNYRDTPTVCFAAGFVKGQEKFVDYFTCQQCNMNCECVCGVMVGGYRVGVVCPKCPTH